MTYGIARAATSPELDLFNIVGKKQRYYVAIHPGRTIFTARVNQVITDWDGLQKVAYDSGSGSIEDVFIDMLLLVGTSAGARDVGFLRVVGIDETYIYFDQYSGIKILDNHYLTIIDDFRLLQRHIKIDGDVIKMDGYVTYTDQHKNPDPTPIMGAHRVVELSGDFVDVDFNFSQSYVIDGSGVNNFQISAPTAYDISDNTSPTPTITFDTCGWHTVYCNVVGNNEKQFFGMRYVYVWNKDNLPARVKVSNPSGSVNAGGWSFEFEAYRNADTDTIHEGDLAILFSIDWWGDTEQSIGAVSGSENIECIGWIASPESIVQNPERGLVHFSVQGPQYWMSKISSYPDGVEFKASDPVNWTEFRALNVVKGVWHFLHWRSTLTRIIDFFPGTDTRLTGEVSSLAENLWAQIQEMTALQILARPGFNALGQFFMPINPNLIPTGDRTFPTVMDISKSDWIDELDFDRITLDEICQVNFSGVVVDSGGGALAYFANAPGHTYNHYGTPDILDKLLISSQDEVITLAGLYFSWRNNTLPVIPMTLKANNRLIDIFPNSKCTTTIDPSDNVRGIGFDGGLYPETITVNFDDETGRATRTVEFRTETFESLAVKETVPGSGDVSTLPKFKFPPLPTFPPIPGGIPPSSTSAPRKILGHDPTIGLFYTDTGGVEWHPINSGLTSGQYQPIQKIVVPLNKSIFVANLGHGDISNGFLARSPGAGLPFTVMLTHADIEAVVGSTDNAQIAMIACNPLASEDIYVLLAYGGSNCRMYKGSGSDFSSYVLKSSFDFNVGSSSCDLSYGNGKLLLTNGFWMTLSADGVPTGANGTIASQCSKHVRATTSGKTLHYPDDVKLALGADNDTSIVNGVGNVDFKSSSAGFGVEEAFAIDPTGFYAMGRRATGTPVNSNDGGSTWATMGTGYLPPTIEIKYAYVAGDGNASSWLAGEYRIWYSVNFGSVWTDITGNLHDLNPFLATDIIKVIEI